MQNGHSEQELKDRLELIERMVAEGRRTTENWGWVFVLWGVAYYVALAWFAWGHSHRAWPVTMALAMAVTIAVASSRAGRPATSMLGRAIGSIWLSAGISMFLLFFPLGTSGRLTDQHVFMAIVSAMLGMANGASGLILRWKAQLACAGVWWATAVATCFLSAAHGMTVFLTAIFLCQIVFGLYGMIPGKNRGQHGAIHA